MNLVWREVVKVVRLVNDEVRTHDVIGLHLGMQVHKRCSSEEVTMMKQLYAIRPILVKYMMT
jgi:hypothetical protein